MVEYLAPEVSGTVTITGTSAGATPDSASIDVGLFTLQAYGPGTGYTLIGGDTHGGVHFENHFATGSHIADLQKLGARYYAKFGTGLQYNDSSLPWGGLFDFAWETTPWQKPHGGHRDGMNTDLRLIADPVNNLPALTQAQQLEVRRVWERLREKCILKEIHYTGISNTLNDKTHENAELDSSDCLRSLIECADTRYSANRGFDGQISRGAGRHDDGYLFAV